jgi:hypothetical protein
MSENFLSRWSRLKVETKQAEPSPLPVPPPVEPGEGVTPSPQDIPELPSIESLTKDSDFSAFLRAGIPDDLRKAALSKLWASDPMFSQPEIYDLHMEDYNQPALIEAVKTAWQFGKGMVERLEEANPGSACVKITEESEKTHNNDSEDEAPPNLT